MFFLICLFSIDLDAQAYQFPDRQGTKISKKVNIFENNEVVAEIPTWLGNKKYVQAVIKENINFNIAREKSISDIKVKANFKSPLLAPIEKNSKVGVLTVEIKGLKKMHYDLYSKEKIDKVGYIRKIKRILEYKLSKFIKK